MVKNKKVIKATITITKSKKNKLIGTLHFENGKSMTIPGKFIINESMKDKECEVTIIGGQSEKIIIDGEEVKMKKKPREINNTTRTNKSGKYNKPPYPNYQNSKNYKKNTKNENNDDKYVGTNCIAHAPFNFVPLNKTIVPAENKTDFSIYKGNTGYIDCGLETITPLFIGMGSDSQEKKSPDFFKINGKPVIPASSLRGMIRSLVQVTTWSKFKFFDDELLHYRWLASDIKSLKNLYSNLIVKDEENKDSKDGHSYKFNAGYIHTDNGIDYYIKPAKKNEFGKQVKQILKEEIKDNVRPFEVHKWEKVKKDDEKQPQPYEKYAYLITSGEMKGKKKEWLVYAEDKHAEEIIIPEEDVKAYRKDKLSGAKKKMDLLKRASAGKITPCFYMTWKDENGNPRVMFGHTGYFRLTYKKTIGDHVLQAIPENFTLDLDDAIFGMETNEKSSEGFAGRVHFEDAELITNEKNVFMGESIPHILASPKPTSFQLYLEQEPRKTINHYDSEGVPIRGYKFYWHIWDEKNPHFWEDNALRLPKNKFNKFSGLLKMDRDKLNLDKRYSILSNEGEEKKLKDAIRDFVLNSDKAQYTLINPVKPHTKFKFRIYFENLSDVELGALLFVLNLPENHYYKLGMGKPLGLGSVKITSSLVLSDRKKRYEKLFDDKGWNLAESQKETKPFINSFEKYIMSSITQQEKDSAVNFWDVPRMKELKIMLDWKNIKNRDWVEKTSYMQIGKKNDKGFKDRCILPKPHEVIAGN